MKAGNNKAMAAWHEAGHFVSRWICGLEPTGARVYEDAAGNWVGKTDGTGKAISPLGVFMGADMPFYSSAGLTSEMLAQGFSYAGISVAWRMLLEDPHSEDAEDDVSEILSPSIVDSLKVVFFRKLENATPVSLRASICSAGAVLLRDNWDKVTIVKRVLFQREIKKIDAVRLFSEFGHCDSSDSIRRMKRILGPIEKTFEPLFAKRKRRA